MGSQERRGEEEGRRRSTEMERIGKGIEGNGGVGEIRN